MPDPTVEKLIRQIHAGSGQMVLAVTGGGSQAIADLLAVPGGSRTVLEAVVPYSAESLAEFLRCRPEHYCSARTARLMAMAAFQRTRHLQQTATSISTPKSPALSGVEPRQNSPIGIGCTASLASDRPKRGPHRIHVAVQTIEATSTHSLELIKDRRSRVEEELVASRIVLNAVAGSLGIKDRLPLPLIDGEQVEAIRTIAPQPWQELLNSKSNVAPAAVPVSEKPGCVTPRIIFPGAFNPLHRGHLQMAEIAARRLGTSVEFEISIENVDKPPLDYTEMEQRAAQFAEKSLPQWFTRAPTFDQKSALFPGATFIVGTDTLLRIAHCKYYGNDPTSAEASIARIAQRGCRFLVFGRTVEGKFETLADLELPDSLRKLCDEVPAGEFREDISSTELRRFASS